MSKSTKLWAFTGAIIKLLIHDRTNSSIHYDRLTNSRSVIKLTPKSDFKLLTCIIL
jgi:hypothetical protein